MKQLNSMIAALATLSTALTITACGGGGGGGRGDGGAGYTHNELAQIFVDKINATGELSVELVKSSTGQYNYIVVRDIAKDEFNAYLIAGYTPDQDPIAFLASKEEFAFYDLDEIPAHSEVINTTEWDTECNCYYSVQEEVWVKTAYRDRPTDTYFEKVEGTPKDRLKLAAVEEALTVQRMAENLSANYGLSAERSHHVAKVTYIWQQLPQERKTAADDDRFAKEIFGHTISEFVAAGNKMTSGDATDLKSLIESSAHNNGITPEQANEIVQELL